MGAVWQQRSDGRLVSHDIQLDLVCREGRWEESAWGFEEERPGLEHEGRLLEAKVQGGRLHLAVRLTIAGHALRNRFTTSP